MPALAKIANHAMLGNGPYVQKQGIENVPTRNINLTKHFDQFVEDQIGRGQYSNASEVLRRTAFAGATGSGGA